MESGLSNCNIAQLIDITTNIDIQICLMRDFFEEDGGGYISCPQCSMQGNLGVLMGIKEGLCEGSKEEKKYNCCNFF